MKSKVIIRKGYGQFSGSWYDSEIDNTIHFSAHLQPTSVQGFPESGTTILVKIWDNAGERDEEIGNTDWKYLGTGFIPRTPALTPVELIKELLNLP